jgi:diguanylate cyclase (GGDEF)-like protein
MNDVESDFTPEQLFELKLGFFQELERGLRRVREAQERFLKHPGDVAASGEIRDFFHRIAGFAHTVRLAPLAYTASIVERVADLVVRNQFSQKEAAHIFADALASVSAVLDAHGWGHSAPPVSRRNLPAYEAMLVPDAIGEGRELSKILVIDDDRFSAGLIDSTLRGAGLLSNCCCDPRDAIAKIEEELPDLIIMDVMMPDIDGFELCRRVRANPALQFTPIIFVTRKGELEARVRGLELGGNDYIAKPFEPQELVARVRSHLIRLATLRQMAIRDGLTRCFNHRFLKMRLEQEVARARRYEHKLAIAMIDLDRFKSINDNHGHPAGDLVLAHVSNLVLASVRGTDVVARYGGEEFVIVMVHAGAQEARIVCERIRQRIAAHAFVFTPDEDDGAPTTLAVTVSVGVAEYQSPEGWRVLVQRVDAALYESKGAGRNCVTVA